MIKEIYCRQSDDSNLDPNKLEHSNVYELILGKIRMILTTTKGSVLGHPSFGVDLDKYIFETHVSAASIEEEIKSQMAIYMPESANYAVKVKVELMKGQTTDTGLVSVYIDGHKMMGLLVS